MDDVELALLPVSNGKCNLQHDLDATLHVYISFVCTSNAKASEKAAGYTLLRNSPSPLSMNEISIVKTYQRRRLASSTQPAPLKYSVNRASEGAPILQRKNAPLSLVSNNDTEDVAVSNQIDIREVCTISNF